MTDVLDAIEVPDEALIRMLFGCRGAVVGQDEPAGPDDIVLQETAASGGVGLRREVVSQAMRARQYRRLTKWALDAYVDRALRVTWMAFDLSTVKTLATYATIERLPTRLRHLVSARDDGYRDEESGVVSYLPAGVVVVVPDPPIATLVCLEYPSSRPHGHYKTWSSTWRLEFSLEPTVLEI